MESSINPRLYILKDLKAESDHYVLPHVSKAHIWQYHKYFDDSLFIFCNRLDISYSIKNGIAYFPEESYISMVQIYKNRNKLSIEPTAFYSSKEVTQTISLAQSEPLSSSGLANLVKFGVIKFATSYNHQYYYYKEEVIELETTLYSTKSIESLAKQYNLNEKILDKIIHQLNLITIIKCPYFSTWVKQIRVGNQEYEILTAYFKEVCGQLFGQPSLITKTTWDFLELFIVCQKYIVIHHKYRECEIYKIIKKCLNCMAISYREEKDNISIKKEDGEIFRDNYLNFKYENYYSFDQIGSDELLGISISTIYNKLNKLVLPIMKYIYYDPKTEIYGFVKPKRKYIYYYSKTEIDKFVRMRKETISSVEVMEILGWPMISYLKDAVRRLRLEGKDIEVITKNNHVFGNHSLVRGYKELIKNVQFKNKLKNLEDRCKVFELYIRDIPLNNDASKTLREFHDFIQIRYNKKKSKRLPYSHSLIYKRLSIHLKKEIFGYNPKELELLIKTLAIDMNIETSFEFHHFIAYCNDKYNGNTQLPVTKYDNTTVHHSGNANKKRSYSNLQWENFRILVFGSLDNPVYFEKALMYRGLAIPWLYFALHFAIAFRANDIRNIPKPDLNIIGFRNGQDFLDYLSEGGKFTDAMGDAICINIAIQLKSYGKTASKNGQILRFIIGESMVRPIGLLLSMCEAHRQAAKGGNKELVITHTSKNRRFHLRLFGEEYIKIFGEETFGNIKAVNTYARQISEKGGTSGVYLMSVLRSHTVLAERPSSVTADIYMTNGYMNPDKDLDRVTFNLFERGTFSFAPYKMLFLLNKQFAKLDYSKQTELIKKLGFKPSEVEKLSKVILNQKSEIDILFDNIIQSDENIIKIALNNIAGSKTPGKHQFTQCLLKAILDNKNKVNDKVFLTTKHSEKAIIIQQKCVYPTSTSCIGCMFLIAEKLFLIELNDRMWDTASKLENAKSERSIHIYNDLLMTQKNILKEAVLFLGKDKVNNYVSKKLREKMLSLEKNII